MIAAISRFPTSSQAECHALFEAMIPRIERFARYAFRRELRSLREDLVAEVVANAYLAFARLFERGKLDLAFPTVLARYACKQVRAGRRVGNRADIRDLTSPRARRRGAFVHGLFELDERGRWQELVVEDRKTRPADVAACRIDFAAWLRTLPVRSRKIAEALAVGSSTSHVAQRFQVTPGRVSQLRLELKQSWEAFHGEPLAEAA